MCMYYMRYKVYDNHLFKRLINRGYFILLLLIFQKEKKKEKMNVRMLNQTNGIN